MCKFEVWSDGSPMTFWVECIDGITGSEDEILVNIVKQDDENSASRLFNLMMSDKTHKDGLDLCLLDGVNEYSYYGYNMVALIQDKNNYDNNNLNIRVTFRKEYATADKEESDQ